MQTVSDGWEPGWAATLIGSQQRAKDRRHRHPEPSPHPAAEPTRKRTPPLQLRSERQHRQHTILAMMDKWLKEIEGVQRNQSLMQHALAISEFAETQPPNRTCLTVDRRTAGHYMSNVLLKSGIGQKTVNRKISSLSSMWRWLCKRGFASDNPWQGQGSSSSGMKRDSLKRAYRPDELVALFRADPVVEIGERYGRVLYDLMRLGLLTGCRIGELCQLRVEDVMIDQQAFRIPIGKTENARRVIPIHRLAWPIIIRRLTASVDGWIFPGLKPGGPDQKRSWIVVKRFSTFRRKVLGFSTEIDFHSFRRCFATYLERASTQTLAVNSSVIAELMGHQKSTLASAVYSSGLVHEQLRSAIDSLDLSIERCVVDGFLNYYDQYSSYEKLKY